MYSKYTLQNETVQYNVKKKLNILKYKTDHLKTNNKQSEDDYTPNPNYCPNVL